MKTKPVIVTTPRLRKAICEGVVSALTAPTNLILADLEAPLSYRKFSVDDAWREVGSYIRESAVKFEDSKCLRPERREKSRKVRSEVRKQHLVSP